MSKPNLETLVEEYTSKILREIFDEELPDELNVYDFDDTLVRTEGTIHLLNTQTGERRELHPHEFHEYELGPDEEFDLSDFGVVINPVKLPHLSRMKSDYARLGPYGVAICTARPSIEEVAKFMAREGMGDIEMVGVGLFQPVKGKGVGEHNARRKKDYLKGKLQQRKLKVLRFFDDNEMNCAAAKTLAKEFPDVQIEVELVK